MSSRAVVRFQRELTAGLKSGKNAIGIVQAVDGVASAKDLLLCLDLWCAAYDPTDWTVERQKKQRPQFETARTAGYLLFRRAIELATPANDLAELVQSMPKLATAQQSKKDRYCEYARRYASLDDKTRSDIVRELDVHLKVRKEAASQKRLLIDTLAEAFRRQAGRPHKSVAELLTVRFDDSPKRPRFEQLASACERAWTPTFRRRARTVTTAEAIPASAKGDVIPMSDPTSTSGKVDVADWAFGAFVRWVEDDMVAPLDFFRLAAWIREASDALRVQTWKHGQFHKRIGGSPWSNVWEELYLEVVARAQHLALSQWHIKPARPGRAFVGDDASFIELPLGQRGKELLRNRLGLAAKDRSKFVGFNKARRRAHIIAKDTGLILLDEVETKTQLQQAAAVWMRNPLLAARRNVMGVVNQRPQRWWLNQTIEDAFTVASIIPGKPDRVILDVHATPGFFYAAHPPYSGLSKIHQDAFFRRIAKDANIMADGVRALYELMGYVFDVVTAIIPGGGLRIILFRIAIELLKDKATEVALDAAKIENPWVRGTLTMAVNLAPMPKVRPPPIKTVEELDLDAARKAHGAQTASTARAEAVNKHEAVKERATEKPYVDRGTSPPNRASGGGMANKPKLPGPQHHFPFGGGGTPLPKPESPNKVYRIMSNDEAAKTLKSQKLPPPIRGAEGERFVSLDSDYSMLFREKELADIEEIFADQIESARKSLKNIDDRLAQLKAEKVPNLDAISKLNTKREAFLAEQRQRYLARKAEAEEVIGKWHEAEGQQVVVEIELESGALDDILSRSVDKLDWGQYSKSGKDVYLWKFERNYGRNIGIPKWQLDAFNARIKSVRMHSFKQPLGKVKPGLGSN